MGSKGGSGSVYKYYIGMHHALCYGPIDSILALKVGDRIAWEEGQTGSGTISVDAKDLFGGLEREGGVSGEVDIAMGESTQEANQYLSDILSPYEDDMPIPAFKGVVSAFLKQVYVGLNPYIKDWAWQAKRTQTGHNGGDIWYQEKADIDGDLNAAHIIYESMVATWGLGYPTSTMDDDAWRSAADGLFDEGFGLSLQWVRSESIEDFIKLVLGYINGRVYTDQVTGLTVLKLIREDYVVDDLPLFDESNVVSLDSFQRRGWGETTNEVTVAYTDRDTGEEKLVTLQNIANITQQGRKITLKKDYSAISSPSLAARVCQRELGIMTAPLASFTITVNRQAWNMMPGEAFRFSWASEDLVEVVFRVGDVDWGELTDGRITISAVQDHFTFPSGSYWEEQPPGWNDPNEPPEIDTITTEQDIMELPYYEVAQRVKPADMEFLDPDHGFVGTLEREPHGNTFWYGYNLYTSANNDPPPSTPPIEESSYDYDVDLSVGNHLDVPLTSGQTKTLRMKFPSTAGQSLTHYSLVPISGDPCTYSGVKFYNYTSGTCRSESSETIATDSQYTSWVVARDQYFYVTITCQSGSGTVRYSYTVSTY